MAAVTLGNTPSRRVIGDLVDKFYTINGISGSTLDTKQSNILFVNRQLVNAAGTASVITAFTVVGSVITFTTSGAMVNEVIAVTSRVG